jgi:hypothetical protein
VVCEKEKSLLRERARKKERKLTISFNVVEKLLLPLFVVSNHQLMMHYLLQRAAQKL